MTEDIIQPLETQFSELLTIIQGHRSAASRAVNTEQLQMAWEVGAYVSSKLKTEQWGSKVVTQFVEYARHKDPSIKGFSRSAIYNMVNVYEEFSKPSFLTLVSTQGSQKLISKIIQPMAGQLPMKIVQPMAGQLPSILTLTCLTNLISIINKCKIDEERFFYILYAYREGLNKRELIRCIDNNTFTTLLGSKGNLSKGLLEQVPHAPVIFKDTAYIDFLGLPVKHSEKKLRKGIVAHIKEFILELGKDFIFMGEEYPLEVGGETFHIDLLFFHRGIQALCAVELKKTPFHPKDMGQLNFYLEALDRDVKRSNENPSIGILLCPSANKTVVEYAMSRNMSPTLVAEYKRQLIPKEKMQILLDEYCEYLNEELK